MVDLWLFARMEQRKSGLTHFSKALWGFWLNNARLFESEVRDVFLHAL